MAEPQNGVPSDRTTEYSGWMSQLGREPSGDVGTLLTGLVMPWVLYGKIEERLVLLEDGEDIHNVGCGWNPSGCIWLSSFFGACGFMTANRRTIIRGHFGIDGSIVSDCILGVFLSQCVLVQMDREIRARHGHTQLRNHPDYKQFLDRQPRLVQEMVYMPTSASTPEPSSDEVSPTAMIGLSRVTTRHQLQEVLNASDEIDEIVTVVQQTIPLTSSRQVIENLDELVQAAENAVGPSPSTNKIKTFFGNITPDLISYFKPASSPKKTDAKNLQESPGHAMVNIKVTTSIKAGQTSVRVQAVGERGKIDTKVKKTATEHSSTDCETIVVGGQRSSNASVQQMSYVHDFTDCPVDRDVLEYMEREEKRSHGLDECLIEAPAERKNLGKGSGPRDCCGEDLIPATTSKQHQIEECDDSIVLEGVEQHILGDCSRISSVASEVVQQHHLDDCTRLSSIASAIVKDIVHRQAPEVSRARSQKAEADQMINRCCDGQSSIFEGPSNQHLEQSKQAGLGASPIIEESSEQNCCDLYQAFTPPHRLSTCFPDEVVGENDQHHQLFDCSVPIHMPTESTQHRLSTCSHDDSSNKGRHGLSSCYPSTSSTGQNTPQHRLSTCSHNDSTNGGTHDLAGCCPSASSTGQITPQYRQSTCSQTTLPRLATSTQNRFWPFSRSSSTSALVVQKNRDPGRLDGSARSISMPSSAQKKAEDSMEDFSRRSSATVTPAKRYTSAIPHTLENCRCGDSSEDSHHREAVISEPEPADKGKQVVVEDGEGERLEAIRRALKKSETSVRLVEQTRGTRKSGSGSQNSVKPVTVRRRAIVKTEPAVSEPRKVEGVKRAVSSGVRPARRLTRKISLNSQRAAKPNSLGTQVIKRIELSKKRSISGGGYSTKTGKKENQSRQRAVSSDVLPTQVASQAYNEIQRALERNDSTIKLSKNGRSQHSFEEVVYNDCEQANAESTENKPKPAVISVDVVVDGKRMTATPVPNTLDGTFSQRTSVVQELRRQPSSLRSPTVRERSAQASLQNVLATSPRKPSYGEPTGSVRRHPYHRFARAKLPENYENGDGVVVLGTPGPISMSIHQAELGGATRRDSDAESLQTSIASGFLSAVTGLGRRSR